MVDDLLARLSGSGVFIQGYADDICLLAVGKFPNMVSGLMQCAPSTVETWCNEVRLSVNPVKTGLIAFTRKRKLPGFFEPQFFGVKLRLLGVGQVSGGYSGFSGDLERACGCQGEEDSQFALGL